MKLHCSYCEGKGEIEFTKERGGPVCPMCAGNGFLKKDQVDRYIGAILDHPSLYMGGPSQRSLKIASKISNFLAEWGVEFE